MKKFGSWSGMTMPRKSANSPHDEHGYEEHGAGQAVQPAAFGCEYGDCSGKQPDRAPGNVQSDGQLRQNGRQHWLYGLQDHARGLGG